MYNPEEDIVPLELIEQALAISNVVSIYKVYFNNETGEILAITNEENSNYSTFIEVEYELVKDFLTGKKQSTKYKVSFVDQSTPTIVLKSSSDTNFVIIEKVNTVDHWRSMFTIENYPLLKKWAVTLRSDQRTVLKNYNLNTVFEVYVVDSNNHNFLFRTIKIFLKDVIDNDRYFIDYSNDIEADIKRIDVFVKKFFDTTGYQVLYDTNS